MAASNATGECSGTRSCPPPAKARSWASAATSRWRTPTAFGTPVDPEVNITYANWSRCTGTTRAIGSPSRAAATSSGVSTTAAPA
ncbi:hypothetical protein SANTM175S_04197 [Streptomyces antimycoticus]